MGKMGVEEWLVSAVLSMYTGAKTVLRTVYGNNNGFEVKVGVHQGSALSYLLGARCRWSAYGPADATAPHVSAFLVPAYPDCPWKEAVKWECVFSAKCCTVASADV